MTRHQTINGKARHLHGWKRGRADSRDMRLKAPMFASFRLPPRASVRSLGFLKVEDQGDIGSCTCNSGTSAVEFAHRKQGRPDLQLSRLFAYAKVRILEGTPLEEDSGAEIRDVMKVLAHTGCAPEAAWPYDLHKWTVNPGLAVDAEAAQHKIVVYYRCPTLSTVKASISQGFPVVGGFQVPANMMTGTCAASGLVRYAPQEPNEGGHAVLFTGYDSDIDRLEFLNSWGEGWGDKGYGSLDRASQWFAHGYCDDFWTVRLEA